MNVGLGAVTFTIFFVLYWWVLSILVDAILESPQLKQRHWFAVGTFNALVVFCIFMLWQNTFLCYVVMMTLMLAELYLFYKDSFAGALLCTFSCAIHVISFSMVTISVYSLATATPTYKILADGNALIWCLAIAFLSLDVAIWSVIKIVPLPKVKLINQHIEQRWFIIAWMSVSIILLVFMYHFLYSPDYPAQITTIQIAASAASLVGLYIVLFFSIKTSALIGYREKNAQLEQVVQQEQQYRNFMVRDALVSYEVNLTQDLMTKGVGVYDENDTEVENCYSDLLVLMAQKTIYSEDIGGFVRSCERTNLLRLFEKGERELITEYRRLIEPGEYIWVRAIINLMQDVTTGDIKGFACIKNIDHEKKSQLELQRQAELDALTGLYNRSTASKLIDEHIAFHHGTAGSALFMIDVDNFKEINDNLGHIFGDAVLCELAEKLTHIFRSDDIIGRIGGDEYIAFLKDSTTIKVAQEKAAEICKAFHITYQGGGSEQHTISGSVGVALFPNDGVSFQDLYSHADIALYAAKSDGKNGYKFYDGSGFSAYASQRTEIQTVGNVLQKSFRENRIEYAFKILYQSDSPGIAIHSVLELVTKHFSFERGYIFQTSKDGKTSSNTFEWCAPGVTPEIDNLQEIPIEAVATAHANFQRCGTFVLKSLNDLNPVERAVLEPQGIKSMFQFGIFDKSHLLGFVGFDNCTSETVPSDTELDELKTICNILATFFVKQYIDEITEKDLIARQEVMNHLDNYIYVIDTQTFELLFMNEKIQSLLEAPDQENTCYSFFRGNSEQCADCPMRQLIQDGSDRMVAELYNKKLGIWMESSASLMRWADGSLACLINCTDITKQKREHLNHVDQLENLLYVDALTGGHTYQKFQIEAQRNFNIQPNVLRVLVKLDIANFKLINQIYGFEKGNEILCYVTKAMELTMRKENEIFARINNDEFVALFTIADKSEIEDWFKTFYSHFQRLIGADFSFRCRFPHGRYVIEPGAAKEMTIHDMFEKVNIAHKVAKLNKAVDFMFYDEQMTKEALRVKQIENRMLDALSSNEFSVYFQPKYYLYDETIGGAEALTRWNDENGNQISPNTFIDIFEQNGFITKLDFYVFEKTCQTIKKWGAQGIDPVTVSVNFSRLHLGDANFVKKLCEIVDRIGIERKYLEIEITETVIFDNIDRLGELLEDIHKNGFSMSMDDFGSGYSSLGMLKDFPVDVIKMDRSFFANQKDAVRSKIVVHSIIQMATDLGIRIVAEGVEEQAHIDFLRELKCDMVQGYYYAKPMPIDDFTKLLRKERESKK